MEKKPYGFFVAHNKVSCRKTDRCKLDKSGIPIQNERNNIPNENEVEFLIGCYKEKTCGDNVVPIEPISKSLKKEPLFPIKFNMFLNPLFFFLIISFLLILISIPTWKRFLFSFKNRRR
jgi:hypothetical protein